MDMEKLANAAASAAQEGDLADVVARANTMASSSTTAFHHQLPPLPPAAAQRSPPQYPAGQIIIPLEEKRAGDAVVLFDPAPPVDPYLSVAATGTYRLPQQQLLAFQISQGQNASYGHEFVLGAAADVNGDDATRNSPPPAPPHQMINSDCGMPCTHIPYGRKNDVRKVVCIPAPPAMSNRSGGGGEVIPSDLWAWRKYGQKPIKGSPYPRGYYRCSSSKGCMARKQVERSRSDPNMLVITYTAEHNHPWPMHRNVLAGYARAHTQAATTAAKKQQHHRINNNVASSSTTNSIQVEKTATIGGHQLGNHMMPAVAEDGATAGCLMFEACNGVQPDELFAELEELEPDNSSIMISANVYGSVSRGVSSNYEWHKF